MIIQRRIAIAQNALFAVNLSIIIFLAIIINQTIDLICLNDLARDFLEKIKRTPFIPWQVSTFSIFLMILLFSISILRERISRYRPAVFYVLSILDLLLCIGIMYFLNFGYKGILLLAIANTVVFIDGKKGKYFFLIIMIIIYILFDYDIFSIKISMFSINDYIQYHTSAQRLYIFSIRNFLFSLNEMIFIVLLILVIQRQIDENTKIKDLYAKLSQTAEELKIVNIQLQDYSKKSEEMAKTRERNRLAREIHDTLGHTLTGIATGLEAYQQLINDNPEHTKIQISKIAHLAQKGLLDVRRSVSELRPDSLNRFTLVSAIQNLSKDINDCTNTKIDLVISDNVQKLTPDEEEVVYRIVQEGITNAVRHGKAGSIRIFLRFDEATVRLEIADDGIGCDSVCEGFGIKHIRERVSMLAGKVNFEPNQPRGFKVVASIPIRGGYT